jgi:hypothetical protein
MRQKTGKRKYREYRVQRKIDSDIRRAYLEKVSPERRGKKRRGDFGYSITHSIVIVYRRHQRGIVKVLSKYFLST